MLTGLPLGSIDPLVGLVEITKSLVTDADCFAVTVPTFRPTLVMDCSAAVSGELITFGTGTPGLLPVTYLSSTMAAISTTTTVASTTQGQARRWRWGGPSGPPSSGPYRYGGIPA